MYLNHYLPLKTQVSILDLNLEDLRLGLGLDKGLELGLRLVNNMTLIFTKHIERGLLF